MTWQHLNKQHLIGHIIHLNVHIPKLMVHILNIKLQVLDGVVKSALFNVPSKELICSGSDTLLQDMKFRNLNCPLEQEYPGQVESILYFE